MSAFLSREVPCDVSWTMRFSFGNKLPAAGQAGSEHKANIWINLQIDVQWWWQSGKAQALKEPLNSPLDSAS